jgi:integrase
VPASGVNPIEARRAHARAAQKAKTFGECADALIQSKRSGWRSDKHARQWAATLETYAKQLRGMPVADVDTAAGLSVLKPHWQRVPETTNRLRGRSEAVLDYAKAHGWRSGENPAAWRGHLALILSKRQKLERKRLEAMAFEDIPAFVDKLRTMDSIAARALELAILTAARTEEIIGMRWGEVDFENRIWTVPGSRMKAGREHRVPLSSPAMALLEGLEADRDNQLVFPRPLRSDAMLALVEGATVHGMRSAFRNWCADVAQAPREIAEACLAHATGSAVEQAYLRTDVIERRRKLMEAWGQFCCGTQADNVHQLMNRAG